MSFINIINKDLLDIKNKKPLVHHITNYVTANDCANITLAIGASPVMADSKFEVEDMVSLSSSLVINMGTINERTLESMILAGKKANELNIPVILDPVGCGATKYRYECLNTLIKEVNFYIIKGNISEIKTLGGVKIEGKGVDACDEDLIDGEESTDKIIEFAKKLSNKLNSVIAVTGAIDVICFKNKASIIKNGTKMLTNITGTGCMGASIIGSYASVTKDYYTAALEGVLTVNIAGEIACKNTNELEKNQGTFKEEFFNAVSDINESKISKRINIEER